MMMRQKSATLVAENENRQKIGHNVANNTNHQNIGQKSKQDGFERLE